MKHRTRKTTRRMAALISYEVLAILLLAQASVALGRNRQTHPAAKPQVPQSTRATAQPTQPQTPVRTPPAVAKGPDQSTWFGKDFANKLNAQYNVQLTKGVRSRVPGSDIELLYTGRGNPETNVLSFFVGGRLVKDYPFTSQLAWVYQNDFLSLRNLKEIFANSDGYYVNVKAFANQLSQADVLYIAKKYEDAADMLSVIDLLRDLKFSGDPEVNRLLYLGLAYGRSGMANEAEKSYGMAAILDATSVTAVYGLASIAASRPGNDLSTRASALGYLAMLVTRLKEKPAPVQQQFVRMLMTGEPFTRLRAAPEFVALLGQLDDKPTP